MAGERRTFQPLPFVLSDDPQEFIDNPEILALYFYDLAIQFQNIIETDLTASNGVILIGTDIQHADTSSIANVSFTGVQVVATATFDTFGHIQTLVSRNLTASNGVTIVGGDFQHADTSSIANATLTGAQVLSTLTFDGFGHAQALTTRNITPADIGAQPVDDGLTSISALTTAADEMIFTTALDVYATTPLTAFARTFLDDVDAAAVSVTLELEIGVDVQAFDDGLESISGLTTVADRMIFTTALDVYAVTTLTSFARTLLDDASAATARTTLGLGSIATQAANNVAITGGAINGTTVGASTASTGEFTTLTATGETFLNLPTVSTGTSGSLWSDSGTVKVVP